MTPTPVDPHDQYRLSLGLFVLGALPIGEQFEVEEHLTSCAECRAERDELAEVPQLLAGLSAADWLALAAEFGTDPADGVTPADAGARPDGEECADLAEQPMAQVTPERRS